MISATAPHCRPDAEDIRYGEYRRDPGLPLGCSFVASGGINRADRDLPFLADLI